jgi:hypothetical protein
MCLILEVSRSGYYAWRIRDESPRSREDRRLTALIHDGHERSRSTYRALRVPRCSCVARKRCPSRCPEAGLGDVRRVEGEHDEDVEEIAVELEDSRSKRMTA